MPPVCEYSCCINSGNMAQLFCCNRAFAMEILFGAAMGAIFAPRDFIDDKNSEHVIVNTHVYMSRAASCAAICVSRSSVALPPSPPPIR